MIVPDIDVSGHVGAEVDPSGDFGAGGANKDLLNGHYQYFVQYVTIDFQWVRVVELFQILCRLNNSTLV